MLEVIANSILWTIAFYWIICYIASWLALPFIVWIVAKDRGWHQGRAELRRDYNLPRLSLPVRHG